jgi:hypothetical protein
MHYRGFVFVDEPTEEAVQEAMKYHGGRDDSWGRWDWYRCGGREDGYLQGDEEMTRRETDNGFNFSDQNKSASRNSCKARDLPADRQQIYFFVVDGVWVEREIYISGYPHGRFEDNALFRDQLSAALAEKPDRWVVVVDAHN